MCPPLPGGVEHPRHLLVLAPPSSSALWAAPTLLPHQGAVTLHRTARHHPLLAGALVAPVPPLRSVHPLLPHHHTGGAGGEGGAKGGRGGAGAGVGAEGVGAGGGAVAGVLPLTALVHVRARGHLSERVSVAGVAQGTGAVVPARPVHAHRAARALVDQRAQGTLVHVILAV